MTASQFRLVTRSDFDGLVCGVLLKELDLIDEIAFCGPKERIDELLEPWRASPVTTIIVDTDDPAAMRTMAELVL